MKKLVIIFLILGNTNLYAQDSSLLNADENKRGYFQSSVHYSFKSNYQRGNSFPFANTNEYDYTGSLDLRLTYNYYLIKRYFSIGSGIGFSRTYTPNFNQAWLLFNLKGYLSDEPNTVYFYLNGGKSVPIGDQLLNGQGLGLGVGYRFELNDQLVCIDLNLFNRSVSFDGERYINSNDKVIVFGSSIGIGYIF